MSGWKASRLSCSRRRVGEPRAAVADVHAPLAAQAVEVAVALDVGDPRAVALGKDQRPLGALRRPPAHLMPDVAVPDRPVGALARRHPRHPFAAADGCQWSASRIGRGGTRVALANVSDQTEQTTGGALGRVAGKAKAAAGAALGDDDLAREGRLQQAQSEAEAEAARERELARQAEEEADAGARRAELEREREQLRGELAAEEREAAIERDRERRGRRRHSAARERPPPRRSAPPPSGRPRRPGAMPPSWTSRRAAPRRAPTRSIPRRAGRWVCVRSPAPPWAATSRSRGCRSTPR